MSSPAISLPAQACYPELQLFPYAPAGAGPRMLGAGGTRDISSPVPTAGKRCEY